MDLMGTHWLVIVATYEELVHPRHALRVPRSRHWLLRSGDPRPSHCPHDQRPRPTGTSTHGTCPDPPPARGRSHDHGSPGTSHDGPDEQPEQPASPHDHDHAHHASSRRQRDRSGPHPLSFAPPVRISGRRQIHTGRRVFGSCAHGVTSNPTCVLRGHPHRCGCPFTFLVPDAWASERARRSDQSARSVGQSVRASVRASTRTPPAATRSRRATPATRARGRLSPRR